MELDHRVHDRLGVHDHLDVVEVDAVEQAGFEQFETLVDEGGRVDRDHPAHRPGGVRHRLLGGDRGHLGAGSPPERPTGGGEDQPADLGRAPRAQRLGERRVLGIDGDDLAGRRGAGHEHPPDDQRLLVGQREGGSGFECGQGGQQARGSGDGVEHDVGGHPGELGGLVGADEQPGQPGPSLGPAASLHLGIERQLELFGAGGPGQRHHVGSDVEDLPGEKGHVGAAGRQAHHPELIASR